MLLKIIHLEELEGWEEDILSDWINGGYKGEVRISPAIRDRMAFLREMGYRHFREVYLVGGRRSGKGFMTALAVCKKIAEAHMLGDPARHYGLAANKEIYFTCVAASLEQAKKFQFADLRDTAADCSILAPYIPSLNEESFTVATEADERRIAEIARKGVKINANFASLRVIPLAAQAGTIRGSASLALVFDEMAHMIGTEGKASADEVYKAATPAIKSFGSDAIVFCNSSPYTMVGQFYDLVGYSLEMEETFPKYPNVMSIKFPSWEMFRNYRSDPRKRFHHRGALVVSPDWPEDMLFTQADKAKKYEERLEEMKDPDTYKVEIRSEWASVVDAFLNPDNVDRAFQPTYYDKEVRETEQGSYLYHYIGHCDPASTTDGFGMALAHVEELPYSEEAVELNPALENLKCKHVVFDTIHKWDPQEFPNHTIDYERVQKELMNYIHRYYPQSFTFDQFNGSALSQWLQREVRGAGLSTIVSMMNHTQRQNWQMWNNFRQALNLNLIHIPGDCRFAEWATLELKFLELKNNRVDHQTSGPVRTSDLAVAIAYVVDRLLGSYINNWSIMQLGETSPAFGSYGGYRIGGGTPDNMPMNRSIENLRSIYSQKYLSDPPQRSIRPR